jgi:PAS domain S-box-containing protein
VEDIGPVVQHLEGALGRGLAEFEAVLDALPQGVVVRDPAGRTVFANASAVRILGLQTPDELMSTPLEQLSRRFEFFAETGEELAVAELPGARALRGEGASDAVIRVRTRADGRDAWVSIRGRPLHGPEGELLLALMTLEDVSVVHEERDRERFFEEVTGELGRSLDYETTLRKMARLTVPHLADWCAVEVLDAPRALVRGAIAHSDPDRERWVSEDPRRFPSAAPDADSASVAELERPTLVEDLPAWLEAAAEGDPRRLGGLGMLELVSAAVLPLRARGRLLGAVTLATAESSRRYSRADLVVFEKLAARYAVALDNARLFRDQQRIAMRLQRSLRPGRLPAVPGLDVAVLYQPAGDGAQAGGDFYDLFDAGPGGWVATIGDVSGKGVDAAAVSALMRHTLRTAALDQRSLPRVLALADGTLQSEDEPSRFCSAVAVRLNVTAGETRAVLANAGHPPPLVVRRDGSIDWPDTSGPILGVDAAPSRPELELQLRPGDALVLYTDGVIEARTGDGFFGEERLGETLRPCAGARADSFVDALRRALSPPVLLRDDVAALVLAMPAGP